MNNQLIQLLTERVALLMRAIPDQSIRDDEAAYFAEAHEEESVDQHEKETILVDFDFDIDNQENFDVYMNIKYFWNDWNPILTDIY